jgi:hypothetical protein
MSLFSKKNIDKAKHLFEKNKDKIADGVGKATDTIDKKTGGKHSDKLRKVDDATKKMTGQAADIGDADADAPTPGDSTAAEGSTAGS